MKKKKIVVLIISLLLIGMLNSHTYAALQANGDPGIVSTIDGWIRAVRKMETLGETLGLNETINETNLLSTSGLNGVDIHMIKNTEYGATAILSASSYGNPQKIENGQTTTGNETGIVIYLNKEWVSAGILSCSTGYVNANSKYKDTYSVGGNYSVAYVARPGDAISETAGWHGSGASTWISSSYAMGNTQYRADGGAGLIRAYSGSIFSYYGYSQVRTDDFLWATYLPAGVRDAYFGKSWYSRAIMICGENI